MSSYGWTLEQALDLTMPQAMLLFRTMTRRPTLTTILGAVFGPERKEAAVDSALSALGGSVEGGVIDGGKGAEFLKSLGVQE